MPEAAAVPIARRRRAHRSSRHGRRSFAAYYRWVDDALRHRADGYRLLDSALVGLPGVRRLARQRFRRSAFADVHAARALLQQATERASAVLTPRQVLALKLYCEGSQWSPLQRVWAGAVASIYGPRLLRKTRSSRARSR